MKNGTAVETASNRVTMKLERHYRPAGEVEIIGHFRPKIEKRHPSGRIEVIQEEAFIAGEPAPPPYPGVFITGKIWAGTILSVDAAEAKTMRKNGIAQVEIPD